LFNGILASQDPDSGMFTYFQATRRSYPKLYCSHEHWFFCCTGTGTENHAKHGDSIYFHHQDVVGGPAMPPGADLVAGNVSFGKTFTGR